MTIRRIPPRMTYILLGINILMFIYLEVFLGSSLSTVNLIKAGANFSPLIANGQWWRLVTASFIHIGLSHLFMNMLTLFFMGEELEMLIGPVKLAILYLVAGIGGNLFSFAFNLNVSAGASTSLFGMFASFIVLSKLYPNSQYLWQRARSFTILIALNFINGLLNFGVDNWGHFGGAIFGALIIVVIGGRAYERNYRKNQLMASLSLLALTAILVYIGVNRFSFY